MAKYPTLLASLPVLPHFEQAERLPISRERLQGRLNLLDPEDRQEARVAEDFLTWQRQPEHRSDEDLLSTYDSIRTRARSKVLLDMVTERLEKRVLQAAVRRRHLGLAADEGPMVPAFFPLQLYLRRHWNRPDFGLGARHPWVTQMVELMRQNDVFSVERLLMRRSWDGLQARWRRGRIRFDFEAVLAYLFRWDLVNRWLDYDPRKAEARLSAYADEALNGFI